jgi:hypothetical protein
MNGISGFLEIAEDARVGDDLRASMWLRSATPGFVLADNDHQGQSFRALPVRAALFRMVDAEGRALFDLPLRAALAKLEIAKLYGSAYPTFLLTEDFSQGATRDTGPVTRLFEVRGGRPVFIEPAEDRTAVQGAFLLTTTRFSDWRIVDTTVGSLREIQMIRSYANPKNTARTPARAYVTEYSVLRFDGVDWRRRTNAVFGVWVNEGEENWPDPRLFPR